MADVIKIAICGKMRSGKDAISDHLFLAHGFELPVSFGAALKRIAHDTFPNVPMTPKPRALYQFMNVMRDFDPDVWIRHVERLVGHYEDRRSTKGIVINDARLPNEIEWAKANGFTIIRVSAPDSLRVLRAEAAGDTFASGDLSHESESYVDSFDVDFELVNDGAVDELKAKVNAIVAELKAKGGR